MSDPKFEKYFKDDPELKKELERMRGTPFPPPKPTPKPDKTKKKEELKEIRFTQAPPPTEIKTLGEAEKAESYFKGASDEAKRVLDRQLKAIALQQQAIKDAEAKHQQIVSKRVGEKLTAKSQRAYKKYLDEYNEYMKKARNNESLSKENLDKINQAIKDLEEQLGIVSTFRAKKGKVVEGAKEYKVTYVEDGKSKTQTFDTLKKAENFVDEITTPKPGPIQDLMRARVIKQTDLIDGKVYYALDKPVDKLTIGQRRLLEQAGFILPLPGKSEAERYRNQIESTTNWLANQIYSDLVDKEEAEKVIKELEPIFLSTVKYGPDPTKEMIKKIDLRLAELEKKAKYKEYEGYTIAGLKPLPPEVVSARVAHIGLSATWGAAKATPFIVLGTSGGTVVSGLLAASMIATVANPKNQAMLKQYVREHPQQFVAELSGALVAGYTIAQVRSVYDKYKNEIPDTYTQQLEMQLATDVPDFPYPKGKAFPSYSWQEKQMYTDFVTKLSPEDVTKFMDYANNVYYFSESGGDFTAMSIPELLDLHPRLDTPFVIKPGAIYRPNIDRLTPKYSDIISSVKDQPGTYIVPAYLAAMSIIAEQGYISESDIDKLLKSIEVQNANMNVEELQATWTESELDDLTIPDVISIVDALPIEITTPIIEPITETTIEPVLEVPTMEIPGVEQPTEFPPEEPMRIGLPKFSEAKIRKFRIQLFRGPKSKYKVDFHYPRKDKQSVTVEARSYPEALNRAQRIRRVTQELPNMVDMRRVK